MITFEGVNKQYADGKSALNDLSFHCDTGELAFITGHSGAGKSTILKLIVGLERSSSGNIIINGDSITHLPRKKIPALRQQIGMIFQDHRLLTDKTALDNVALPLIIAGYPEKEAERRAYAALDKVGLLDKGAFYPLQLSSGEQQRVGIARAVVHKPKILLADEPTGNLDPKLSASIMELFAQFMQVGVTVLIATHDLSLIARLPYRIMTLSQGQLFSDGIMQ